jgi:hypothetical protein
MMFDRRHYGDNSTVTAVLPSASELLCALNGQYLDGVLCRSAYGLTAIHSLTHMDSQQDDRLSHYRARLITHIDIWTVCNLPGPVHGARRHVQSLGVTIDGIAAVAARAFHLLMTDDPAGDLMHAERTRLAELEVSYGDLVRDLRAGRCYLPSGRIDHTPRLALHHHEPADEENDRTDETGGLVLHERWDMGGLEQQPGRQFCGAGLLPSGSAEPLAM